MEVSRNFRLAFLIEYYMGQVTFQKNLQKSVEKDSSVKADWFNLEHQPKGLEKLIPVVRQNWSVRAALRGRKIIESQKSSIDGLFFHMQHPALLSVEHLQRIPTLISMDATPINTDEIGVYYGHSHGDDFLHRLSHRINRRAFQAASMLTPWSNWAKRSLISDYGVPEEKIEVIPCGIHVDQWTPKNHSKSSNPLRILFVGADFERKGGKELLKCFTEHFSDRYRLDIITKEHVEPSKGVSVYYGITPNSKALRDLFAEADMFVFPTYGDSFGIVILEAMASGLPVISTRVGAIPEIVVDGESGLLVPAKDGRALREAIEAIAKDPNVRAKMGARGRAIVQEKFDAEKNGRRILMLLKDEIAKARRYEFETKIA